MERCTTESCDSEAIDRPPAARYPGNWASRERQLAAKKACCAAAPTSGLPVPPHARIAHRTPPRTLVYHRAQRGNTIAFVVASCIEAHFRRHELRQPSALAPDATPDVRPVLGV